MTTPDVLQQERQNQLSRLLDAVKQCQVRFGGKTELATEWDSRVACLCSAWELALQHGMKHNNKALSTLKQVTELTGLTKVTGIGLLHDLKQMETEPALWQYVKEHLNKHEQQRFHMLKSIKTDAGRGRAWLRAALNEHTLEKYLHMLLESDGVLSQFYEDWAFLRDQERSSMLPTMAAGLGSILFAIKIDNHELNSIKPAVGLETIISTSAPALKSFPPRMEEEPLPVFAGEGSPGERKVQKKKKLVTIVSFEEDGSSSYTASPVTTPRSPSSGADLGSRFAGFYSGPLPTSPTAVENPNPGNIATVTEKLNLGNIATVTEHPVLGDLPATIGNRDTDDPAAENQKQEEIVLDRNKDQITDQVIQTQNKDNVAIETLCPSDNPTGGTSIVSINMGTTPSVAGATSRQTDIPSSVQEDNKKDPASSESGRGLLSPSDERSEDQELKLVSLNLSGTEEPTGKPPHSVLEVVMPVSNKVYNKDTNVDETESTDLKTEAETSHSEPLSSETSGHEMSVFSHHGNKTQDSQLAVSLWDGIAREDSVKSLDILDENCRENKEVTKHKQTRNVVKTGSVSSSSSQSSLELANNIHSAQENLTPLTPDGVAVFGTVTPLGSNTYDSVSVDSSDVASYSADIEHAAFALNMLQKGLVDSQGLRTQGDGSYTPDPVSPGQETLSVGELKQAVVAMMLRKEEMEQENKSLRSLLDQEVQAVNVLRLEIDEIKKTNNQMKEKDDEKIKALTRENELLKHQLKKYVNAVQMLRREGQVKLDGIRMDEPQEPVPPKTLNRDYSFEAIEFEKKLVQVAEMHGELMEFNEMLHRQLNLKEAQLTRLRQELVDLRGPLPMDMTSDDTSSISSDFDSSSVNSRGRPLISIWIPSAFMRGSGSESHHVYQVYVRIRDEEWNVYRRYAEFHDLHVRLKKTNPMISTFSFPPKKALGNKQARFVEDRRKKLQQYLREVLNMLLETSTEFASAVSKQRLIQTVPFFGDVLPNSKKSKDRRKTAGGGRSQTQPIPGSQQYMGL